MPSSGGDFALLLILLAAVLAFFAWWSWRLRKGIRLQLWVVVLFGLGYVLVFLLVEAEVLHLPWGAIARGAALFDLILLVCGFVPAYRYARRTTVFERAPSGAWTYRGRPAIPAIWLSLFLFRYGIELALLGRVYLFTPVPSHTVSIPAFAVALLLVDALFAVSTGVVAGNSGGIYAAYRWQRSHPEVPGGAAESAAE